jgi:hypothetical protein
MELALGGAIRLPMELLKQKPHGELLFKKSRLDGEFKSLEDQLEMEQQRQERLEESLYRNRLENTSAERQMVQRFANILIQDRLVSVQNSNGMRLLFGLPVLETVQASGIIVVRMIDMAFWKACINAVDSSPSRVLAFGVPGIGKTTTTPLLIRELLLRGKTVVYLLKSTTKSKWYYQFVPSVKGGALESVEADVFDEKLDLCQIPSLRSDSTYYIVDPSATRDDCDPPPGFRAKVIIVSLPDSCHWGASYFGRQRGLVSHTGIKMAYPQWSCEELVAAQPVLGPALDADTVRARFRLFGGIPRLVFVNNDELQAKIREQNLGLRQLKWNEVAMIAEGSMDGINSFTSGEPRSLLMGFYSEGSSFSSNRADLLSDGIRDKIYARWMGNVESSMSSLCMNEQQSRCILQAYVRSLLARPQRWNESFRGFPVGNEPSWWRETSVDLPRCKDVRLVQDPVAAVAADGAPSFVLFHSSDGSYDMVDCIFKDDRNTVYAIRIVARYSSLECVDLTAAQTLQTAFGNDFSVGLYYVTSENQLHSLKPIPTSTGSMQPGRELNTWCLGVKRPDKCAE